MDAENNRVAVKIERARARGADLVSRREVARVDAEKDGCKHALAVRKENARVDLGRNARDARKRTNCRGNVALVGNDVAPHRKNGDVGLKAQDLLLPLVAEAGHHASHDNDGGDAEHHADNRNASNDRRDRALRFKVLSSQEKREAHN